MVVINDENRFNLPCEPSSDKICVVASCNFLFDFLSLSVRISPSIATSKSGVRESLPRLASWSNSLLSSGASRT